MTTGQPVPSSAKETQESTRASADPLVPHLTAETWELIEYRLWSAFAKKLWTVLGGFLTIGSLLSVIALPQVIRARVDRDISGHRERLEALRSEQTGRFAQAERTGLLASYLFGRWRRSMVDLQSRLDVAEADLGKLVERRPLPKKNVDTLRQMFHSIRIGFVGPETLPSLAPVSLAALQDTELKDTVWKARGTAADWHALEKACAALGVRPIYEALDMAPYVLSMENALYAEFAPLHKLLRDPVERAQLYDLYDREFFGRYAQMARTSGRPEVTLYNLVPAVDEFRVFAEVDGPASASSQLTTTRYI